MPYEEDLQKMSVELVDKIIEYDHNSYDYIETFHNNHNEFEVGTDGFLTDGQLSEIQDSSELYIIIKSAHKIAERIKNGKGT